MYDLENRLNNDECALADRDRQSLEAAQYGLANFYPSNVPACSTKAAELSNCYVNLHFRDGYGNANACVIDADSAARLGAKQTNSPHKLELKARVFHGHPHLERGQILPSKESTLIHSEISRDRVPCAATTEKTIDRFVPLIPCLLETVQNPDTIVIDDWQWGGSDTRAFVRDEDLLVKCGYSHDGKTWVKPRS
jgi:hypothetical protein